MPRFRSGLVLLLVAAPFTGASAGRLPFKNYTASEGLGTEIVRCVFQDSRGFIWLGTEEGVVRYDGATFSPFTTANGLASNYVSDVVEDTSGALWIAAGGVGATRYAGDRFTAINGDDGDPFGATVFHVARDGTLYAGSDGVYRLDGSRFAAVPVSGGAVAGTVFALTEDHAGRLWVGTERDARVLEPAGDGTFRCSPPLVRESIAALYEDSSGAMWVGTTAGLHRFSTSAPFRPLPVPESLRRLARVWVRSFLTDAAGRLWFATNGEGVYRLHRDGSAERFAVANGLAGNNVLDILLDREQSLWFATATGASKLSSQQFVNYTVEDGLQHNMVMSITADRAGDLWIGSALGVNRIAGGRVLHDASGYGIGPTFALYSLRTRDGTLWLGSDAGPSRLVGTGAAAHFVTYGPADGWTPTPAGRNRARFIYEDDAGNLWFGNDWGVSLFRRGRFYTYSWSAPEDSFVCGIVRDRGGDLWFGYHSGGGILRCRVDDPDPARPPVLTVVARYTAPDSIPDGRIRCSARDREGNLWFGTRGAGLLRFTLERGRVREIHRFSTESGLAGNYVRAVFPDRRGNLWIGTEDGVNVLPAEVKGRTMFRRLTLEDGLAGRAVQFFYEDARGAVWIATSNGVSMVLPSPMVHDLAATPVYFTQFQVFGQSDSASLAVQRASLAHDQHTVAFEFVAPTYRNERATRYSYLMEGVDRDWSEPTPRRYASYAHLSPGDYIFRVRARNSDDVWSAEPASFHLHVAAPFWRRTWFLAVAGLSAAALAVAMHRARVQRLLHVERLRTKIASDLHDEVGSTLSSIAIMSDIAAGANDPAKTGALVQRIRDSSRTTLESMNDIVWAIHPGNDSFDVIVPRMRRFACDILEPAGVAFTFDAPETGLDVRLPMDVRRDIYLVYKEAINNAARHARCRHVRASLVVNAGRARLSVSDDGAGTVPEHEEDGAPGGNGIRNMTRRARRMHGTLTVQSRPGEGTTIELEVPLR